MEDETDDLQWHALNYRTAAPQHAKEMWQSLAALVDRKVASERERCAKLIEDHEAAGWHGGSGFHAGLKCAARLLRA